MGSAALAAGVSLEVCAKAVAVRARAMAVASPILARERREVRIDVAILLLCGAGPWLSQSISAEGPKILIPRELVTAR